MEPEEKKSNGALIGSIIIIIILIIGGIYIWQSKVQKVIEAGKAQSESLTSADADALNALDQAISDTDTNVDVDINSVN